MGDIADMMLDGTLCQVCGEYIGQEDFDFPQSCSSCEENEEIDHDFTDEVVCPWCGYEHSDSFEFQDTGNKKCPECENEFSFEREIEVTYSTKKIEIKAGDEK